MRQQLLQGSLGHRRGELLPRAWETLFAARGADAWPANAPEKTTGCLGAASSFFSVRRRGFASNFPSRERSRREISLWVKPPLI